MAVPNTRQNRTGTYGQITWEEILQFNKTLNAKEKSDNIATKIWKGLEKDNNKEHKKNKENSDEAETTQKTQTEQAAIKTGTSYKRDARRSITREKTKARQKANIR